jgi:competence protein ComEC
MPVSVPAAAPEVPVPSPRRHLPAAALAFAAGAAAGRWLAPAPAGLLAAAAAIALLCLTAYCLRLRLSLTAGALALAALAGALNFTTRAAAPAPHDVANLAGVTADRPRLVLVTGTVQESWPPRQSRSGRVLLQAESAEAAGGGTLAVDGRVLVTLYGDDAAHLVPGQRVRLPLLLRRPAGPEHPGAFDGPEWIASLGAWSEGSARSALAGRPDAAAGPGALLSRARAQLAALVLREMPESEGPLLNTILLGWKGDLDREEAAAFTRTGTGHLLAVSGIHVMLLVGAVWWMLRALGVRPRTSAAVLVVFALCYAQLAGSGAPVVRAAVMVCLLLLGLALGRESDGLNSLAAAALLMMALWPRQLFQVGFQMSFAAVFFIMRAVGVLEHALRRKDVLPEPRELTRRQRLQRGALTWLRVSLLTSAAAAAGTLPLTVRTFGVITPWAPLVNLAAIPLAGAALAAGLALLVVGTILPPLAPLPAALAWGALRLLKLVVAAAGQLPGSSPAVDAPPLWCLAVFYGAAVLLLWPGLLGRRWSTRGCILALLLSVPAALGGLLPGDRPAAGRLTLLPGWRGHTVLLEGPAGAAAALRTGGSGSEVADLLRSSRLGPVELSVLTAEFPEPAAGPDALVAAGRARRAAVPDGERFAARRPDLAAGAERLAPGWRAHAGSLELCELGGATYRCSDGKTAARAVSVLAEDGGASWLLADLSDRRGVAAAAAVLERLRPRCAVVALGACRNPAPDSRRLLRASGARVALVRMSGSELERPESAELLKLLRASGLVPLVSGQLGALRATRDGDRLRIEHWSDGAWRALGSAEAGR